MMSHLILTAIPTECFYYHQLRNDLTRLLTITGKRLWLVW